MNRVHNNATPICENVRLAREDRSSLRFPFENWNSHDQRLNAYVIGRIVNELVFTMQLTWLEFDECSRPISDLFVELRRLARDLRLPTVEEVELTRAIDEVQARWREFHGSEWHADRAYEFIERLEMSNTNGQSLSSICTEELLDIKEIVNSTAATIYANLCDDLSGFIRLGISVDKAIHPDVSSLSTDFTRVHSDTQQSQNPENAFERCPECLDETETHTRHSLELVPIHRRIVVELQNEIKQLVRALGFECDLDECFASFESGRTSFSVVQDRLHICLGISTSTRSLATVLGVVCHGRNVSRDGYAGHAELSEQQIKIFRYFLDQGTSPTTLSWLQVKANWELVSGCETEHQVVPRRNIDTAISRLNGSITPKGLWIRNLGNSSWVLESQA